MSSTAGGRPTATAPVCALLLLFTACSAAPRGGAEESWREYLQAVDRLRAAGSTLTPGSREEQLAVERFQSLLGDFKADGFAAAIRQVYAEEVFFNDTLKTLRGVDEVAEYLTETAVNLESSRIEFVDRVAASGDYYFRWVMRVRAPRLAGGEELLSVGMTHVRFDAAGKVVLHQDFWDSTGGLFEHVGGLGWLLRRVRQRL